MSLVEGFLVELRPPKRRRKMSTNNMPGFTAENAISEAAAHYPVMVCIGSQNNSLQVQPAMRDTCTVLSGLLWRAYLGGSYTAAQFYYDAMEGAGCFG
jgi:hypothetical protein